MQRTPTPTVTLLLNTNLFYYCYTPFINAHLSLVKVGSGASTINMEHHGCDILRVVGLVGGRRRQSVEKRGLHYLTRT